jgi:hypothetical protein
MSDSKASFESHRDVEKTGLPVGRTVTFHNDAADAFPTTLERTGTIPGRIMGLSPPEGTSQTPNIPIGYRTLSIQVYDSQRFDGPKSGAKKDEDDANFFGKLDFHSITPLEVCNRFNVSPEIGLDSSAAAKRLARNGPNALSPKKSQLWKKLLRYVFGEYVFGGLRCPFPY